MIDIILGLLIIISFSLLTISKLNFLLITIIFISSAILSLRNSNIKISKSKFVVSIILSIFMIVGDTIYEYNNIIYLFNNIENIILTIYKVLGYIVTFRLMFIYIDKYLSKGEKKEFKLFKWYISKLEKYPFKTSFISLFIVLSIYMIAFYPIVLCPDPSYQIKMFFNIPTNYIEYGIQRNPNVFMTNHHPILQTYLIGWCLSLGRLILNDNFGLFIYTLLQSVIYLSVLSYTIKFLKDHNIKSKYLLILLFIYMFVPMYLIYSVSAVKDTLYTAFMILYVLKIYDFINKYKDNKISILEILTIFIIALLICLFRNNGLYVVVISLLGLILYTKKNKIKVVLLLLLVMISMYSYNNILIPILGISDGSIREALSVPFQQTARLVKYHDDIIEEEDKKIIDNILIYDTLKDRYDMELSDPVKNKFNKYTTNEDLKKYFIVWGKYLLKEPICYINATLNNTYGYIYPVKHNWYFYFKYDKRVTKDNLVDYKYNKLGILRKIIVGYAYIFPYIPFIGLISSIGFNTWIVLILTAYLITNKKSKYIHVLIPLYLSILICIVSPANTYFRYAMPYIYVLPSLILLFRKEIK